MGRTKQFLLILLIMLFLLPAQTAFSYDARLHPIITRYALGYNAQYEEYWFPEHMEYTLGEDGINVEQYLSKEEVAAKIEEGSYAEDIPMGLRARTHFYDPVNEIGLTDLPPGIPQHQDHAMSRARDGVEFDYSWTDARDYYFKALTTEVKEGENGRDWYFAQTFRALGQVLHLLQDMAVPAHVRNDCHFPPRVFQSGGKDMYENWTGDPRDELGQPVPLTFTGYPVVEYAKLNSSDEEHSMEKFWDTNIGSATFGKGLAEFTNHNFLSRDTNFDAIKDKDGNWKIDTW